MSAVIHSIDAVGSMALSGTASVTIPVPAGTQNLVVEVGAKYAAVAATSGVTVAVQTSVDGTTFVNAKETMPEIQPAATVLGTGSMTIRLGNDPFALDFPSYVNSIKVTLTNTDATNAVNYAITHQASSRQP